jgi:menaquinone-9 beta-reductase
MDRADVAIVGARCAGSPLAALLAGAGLRVVVLDRARFPSDTASTHVIQPRGAAFLERLGVRGQVLAAGATEVTGVDLGYDDVTVSATLTSERSAAGQLPGLCVRRVVLDALLVEAAAEAGAEIRERAAVTGLLRERGRVVGVRTDAGPVRAELVVGADGRRSTVAAQVGAAEYHVERAGRNPVWGYFEGVNDAGTRLRIGRLAGLVYLACATDAGLFMAGVAPSVLDAGWFGDRERNFTRDLMQIPPLADLLAGARRVGPLRTVPGWYGYFRQAAGPGWVLTGDAGHFKDPTPGQGIADAFHHAETLTPLIAAHLGSPTRLDAALQEWWRWRDADCVDMHRFAADLGAAGPTTPLVREVLRDIAADADGGVALAAVLNRDIRPAELFTTRRIGRAAIRGALAQPREIPAIAREFAAGARNEVRRGRRDRTVGMTAAMPIPTPRKGRHVHRRHHLAESRPQSGQAAVPRVPEGR